MILVNRNFGNYALSQAIGDMFKGSSDADQKICWIPNTNTLATGSSLVATMKPLLYSATAAAEISTDAKNSFQNNQNPNNFFLVTEHFLKTLDKVYTKIWNESFTETGIYNPANLATIYNGFVNDNSLNENSLSITSWSTSFASSINFMLFKKFVDRCITAGILVEEDRLQYEDQISLTNLNRADLSTQIDLDNKLITFTVAQPIDIKPDLNAMASQYLEGKKLFLMMTPYLPNEALVKLPVNTADVGELTSFVGTKQEPFVNYIRMSNTIKADYETPVKQPIAFFKPKTDASKFGRSLPLATHLIWSLGTPADKEIALIEGTPVPDLIFDHLDRISHIDSLVLKIKFDKLQF